MRFFYFYKIYDYFRCINWFVRNYNCYTRFYFACWFSDVPPPTVGMIKCPSWLSSTSWAWPQSSFLTLINGRLLVSLSQGPTAQMIDYSWLYHTRKDRNAWTLWFILYSKLSVTTKIMQCLSNRCSNVYGGQIKDYFETEICLLTL